MCDGFPSASLNGPQVVSPQASAGQFSRQAICGGLNADLQDGGQGRLPETTPGDTSPPSPPSTNTLSRLVRAQRTACTIGEAAPHSEDVLPSASSQRQVGGDVRAQRTTVPTKGRDRIARTRFERTRDEMCGLAARLLAVAPWERDTGDRNASRT